jgi:predicted RNase H-like nuclease
MTTCIIGIDCATDSKKVGLARGFLSDGELIIDKLTKPAARQSVCDVVADWIDPKIPTLLALDAPLGWPASLGQQLKDHSAGKLIPLDPNLLFRRETDRFVKRVVDQLPLDVGADRIARTALAALKYLNQISEAIGQVIPLAWSAALDSGLSAIEVYPAATLKQFGFRSKGYKKSVHRAERKEIFDALCGHAKFETETSVVIDDDDVLDAAVCVLAGYHFLMNQCMEPEHIELARKEGWIWVTTGDEYE